MKSFIGTKLIQADEMTRGEYCKFREWKIPEDENPNDEGYLVKYSDDYISWSPKDIFDKSHLQIEDNPDLPSGVSIGPEMVKSFIESYEVVEFGRKTTVVNATLINGFTLVEASSCVDPDNYSREIGIQICLDRIENKIWNLLGFLLQSAFKGFN